MSIKTNSSYFDTERKVTVRVDSIQDTNKGLYVHYQSIDTMQWGRKAISDFIRRFVSAPTPQNEPVSVLPDNVIKVDFYLKQRILNK